MLTAIGSFCIISIAIGIVIEIIVMYPIQHRRYRDGINNLLVLLIGGIPIAMPTVLSVTMAIGSHKLSEQGAITKRITAIEELAGMDILCSDKTGTLTLNKLTVDKSIIECYAPGVDQDLVLLLAARASRVENQDAIDTCIVNMLADPKEARAGVTELHFLPFNPTDKRTALTYMEDGKMYRASKGAPEQVCLRADAGGDAKVLSWQDLMKTCLDAVGCRSCNSLTTRQSWRPVCTPPSIITRNVVCERWEWLDRYMEICGNETVVCREMEWSNENEMVSSFLCICMTRFWKQKSRQKQVCKGCKFRFSASRLCPLV